MLLLLLSNTAQHALLLHRLHASFTVNQASHFKDAALRQHQSTTPGLMLAATPMATSAS